MKLIKVEQNSPEWLDARKGKITGSKLKDIVVKRGTGKKLGFYELMADRLAIDTGEEDSMERGHALESEALDLLQETLKKPIERGLFCVSDKNPDIALSPDGLIKNDGKYTEAVEVKCLSTARHLQAYFEQEIPDDYYLQVIQYFIVNEDLETLYLTFYDPRVTIKPIHFIIVKRETITEDIATYEKYQEETLKEINDLLTNLAF